MRAKTHLKARSFNSLVGVPLPLREQGSEWRPFSRGCMRTEKKKKGKERSQEKALRRKKRGRGNDALSTFGVVNSLQKGPQKLWCSERKG